jgi:hypothetical protein
MTWAVSTNEPDLRANVTRGRIPLELFVQRANRGARAVRAESKNLCRAHKIHYEAPRWSERHRGCFTLRKHRPHRYTRFFPSENGKSSTHIRLNVTSENNFSKKAEPANPHARNMLRLQGTDMPDRFTSPARHRCSFASLCRLHLEECDNRSLGPGKVKRNLHFSDCPRLCPSQTKRMKLYQMKENSSTYRRRQTPPGKMRLNPRCAGQDQERLEKF